jgi:hypothetical protein
MSVNPNMIPDFQLTPHYVEQILMAYNCNRVMSNEDSRILGQALGVLQRHADEYVQEIAGRVRNGCL